MATNQTKSTEIDRFEALVDALDQYTANQAEHEECEWEEHESGDFEPSAKLRAANEMLETLQIMQLRALGLYETEPGAAKNLPKPA